MDDEAVGRLWNDNARAWTDLTRGGFDVYRDHLNTPAFFAMLPAMEGLAGLDVGCGEGHNTRRLAGLAAHVTAVDIAANFIARAEELEREQPQGIDYRLASALDLPFADGQFDFVTATMSLMDMPDPARAIGEAWRVLKPGGFLQFSIAHPCFDTPHRRNLRNDEGQTYAIEVGDYFTNQQGEIAEWTFGAAPAEISAKYPKFRIPRFTRTVSQWLNMLVDTGFVIERLAEPRPTREAIAAQPSLQDASVVAYFLHVRARKPTNR